MTEIKFLNKNCLNQIGNRNKNRSESLLDKKSPEYLFKLLKKDNISK